MSLYLLLLALQADAPLDPPPLKIRPVVVTNPAPTANPGIVYRPAPTPAPVVNPTIIYTPAPRTAPLVTPVPAVTAPAAPARVAAPLASLSEASRQRIAEERRLNTERGAGHRRELAAAQEAVGRALAADPFDMTALKAALENRDRVASAYREKLTGAVLDLLGDVPPDERVVVARAVIEGELPSRPAASRQPLKPKPTPSPVGR